MNVRFYDLFGGVGGFRLGLEKACRDKSRGEQSQKEWECERQDVLPESERKEICNGTTKSSSSRQLESRGRQEGNQETPPKGYSASPTSEGGENTSQFHCVGYCDFDKHAVQTYNKNFGENHEPKDATEVDWQAEPDFDLLCAGFPCQSFSLAGKRRGFDDTRGTLFFEICKAARIKRPRWLFLENVKGLLSHEKGVTFAAILDSLQELGYFVEWQVLDSQDFGVPQHRERVFIIGHLGGKPKQAVFPLGKINQKPVRTLKETRRTRPGAIDSNYQGGGTRAMIVKPVLTPDRKEKRQHGRRFKEDGEPSFTLTGQDKHGILIHTAFPDEKPREYNTSSGGGHLSMVLDVEFKGMSIRRLTPIECERLQGFPDGWTEGVSDTQRYKQMGNAVTVNVIEAISKELLSVLEEEEEKK